MSQWVRVDDWDTGIHYSGQWVDNQINTGSGDGTDETYLQDAFQGTGHYMNPVDSSPSNLSFAFNGSAVALYGMFAALNASGDPIPSWECFIDGESIAANRAFGQFPWQSYCEKDGLDDGPHTLTANIRYENFDIRNATATAEFWLDFIQYIPSASAITSLLPSLPYFFVDSTDPRLQYQGDWESFGTANMTLAANASFFLDFSGQSAKHEHERITNYHRTPAARIE
ncbi:hypothetical protein BDZ97DRAFT_368273 [Flammula alnicola]|nr:hypothetical protein BDZ97DRAFT_368273 [Flammula alnicola]